jgi:hypothetical protein
MMTQKPILQPGLHDIGVADLENHFLSSFPRSKTRAVLIEGLNKFIEKLQALDIPIELWIDGSFTTDKLDPNDVDLVIFASQQDVNQLDSNTTGLLRGLLDRPSSRKKYGCDVLFSVKESPNQRSYWRGWYGFDRNENPKGIARITVTP